MKTRRGPAGVGRSRKGRIQSRPIVERVEDRLLLTTFTVSNNLDTGVGSLRQAITDSNASTTALPNQIVFGGLVTGQNVITLGSELPAISEPVTIDGTTAPGYSAAMPAPAIQINAGGAGTGSVLDIATSGVTIEALDIANYNGTGITVSTGATKAVITGNYIGTDLSGSKAGTNTGTGIIVNATGVTIGGTTAADRNVITAVGLGIQLATGSDFSQVSGNYLGTNAQGTSELGTNNATAGIEVDSTFDTIGETIDVFTAKVSGGKGNVISGYGNGILVTGNAAQNTITGNNIGTDFTGNKPIPNSLNGIFVNASAFTQIGTTDPAAGNVISSNTGVGILLQGDTFGSIIQANKIGVGADGSTHLGNGGDGILVSDSTFGSGFIEIGYAADLTRPGATQAELAAGNTIVFNGRSGSGNAGVLVANANTTRVGILSNSIYSNSGLGILLNNGANSGITPPNVISALTGGGQTRITGSLFERQPGIYRIQFFTNVTPNPAGTGDGQTFVGDVDVTTDNTGNGSFTTTLPSSIGLGTFLTATATDTAFTINNVPAENNSSQFSAPVQVGQAIVSDVAVTVAPTSFDPATPLVGQPYVYQVTVTNNPNNTASNQDATGVILTDTLPANSTLVTADTTAGATLVNNVLTYNIGALANGASKTFFVTVKPGSTSRSFTNNVAVTTTAIDPNPNNNNDSSTAPNGVAADSALSAMLIPAVTPTPVGSPLTYVLTLINAGPSTAGGVVATVTLPASFTNVVVSQIDQGTYSVLGNVLTINTGIFPSGSSSTVTFSATPNTVGTFQTTVGITSAVVNPITGTFASTPISVPVTVANAADLALTASAPTSVLTGQTLLTTFTVTNNGPSTASAPVVYDLLPAGVTFDPAGSSDSGGGSIALVNGSAVATLKPLAAGDTDTVTIATTPTISGSVTSTATVADPDTTNPDEIDPDTSNNTASVTTLVSPADVSVVLIAPADPLTIGGQVAYQVQVTNNGPATTTNVILSDAIGTQAHVDSTTAGVVTTNSSGSLVTANLGSIAANATVTVTILITPTSSGTLLNSALVASDQVDPNTNNNNATASNLVNPVDLAVTMTGTPSAGVLVGAPITFTFTVTNNGPSTATDVAINDTFPVGTTFVSSSSSQGATIPANQTAAGGGTLFGNLGTLAPGASATVTLVLDPTTIQTATNSVTVSSDDIDTNPSNNTASASVAVTNQPGTINLDSPLTVVNENAGSVTLTLDRVLGSLGVVTVAYSTFDGSALAGLNYTAEQGTVTFLDGQKTATITIPILDDRIIDGATGFYVGLGATTGGATVGTGNVTAILVSNTDYDVTPPVVSSVSGLANPNPAYLNGIVLTFDEPLDPATAGNAANYFLAASNHDAGKGGDAPIPIAAVFYNAANNTVTLVPASVIPANRFYRVIVNASGPGAPTDLAGNVLTGSGGAGTNYDVYFGQGTSLRYIDSTGNVVTINQSGGGTLQVTRAISGDATDVNIVGVVPHKTKLTGSVKKQGHSSGHTTIGQITGLGKFGDVVSTLTTPGFYVNNPTVFASSVSIPTTSTAKAASVTVGKVTPRGRIAQ